jgi:hypothetical protein
MREVDEPHDARIPLKTSTGGLGPPAISFYQALGARQEIGGVKGNKAVMNFSPKLGTTRSETALFLIAVLAALYAVSQFLRNSIGVIANDLARELHLTATQTGFLSSAFFFAFAAVQIPIGILIDRYGPKRTMLATAVLRAPSSSPLLPPPRCSSRRGPSWGLAAPPSSWRRS